MTNDKGADQTARMRRLVWAFVVRKHPEDRFSRVEAHINIHIDHLLKIDVFLMRK